MNHIANCLNAAGFEKPTKDDIRETIDILLDQGMSNHYVEVLIGEILRMYQKWPSKVSASSDLAWVNQAKGSRQQEYKTATTGGGWLYATDGRRIHRIPSVHDIAHDQFSASCASLFKDLIQGHAVTLDSFQNVEETIVEFDGHMYLESHILQAFSGSPVMAAAPTSNGLYLATSGREVIIQEMRI